MSHLKFRALFFALGTLLIAHAVGAQQPSADAPAQTQSEPPATAAESPAKPTSTADAASGDQRPASATPQKAASTSSQLATIVVNGGPSADILRSARDAGFKIKIADGTTHFCKSEAPVGTRFVTESCMNEQQVTLWLSRAQYQREKLQNLLGAPASAH